MDPEKILNLFDSYWFDQQIITKQPPPSTPPQSDLEFLDNKPSLKPIITRLPSRHVRSLSDQLSSQMSFHLDSPSPNSVLLSHNKLQTIHSGKEVHEQIHPAAVFEEPARPKPVSPKKIISRRENKRGSSKSLSDLEFEELKGFIDLGFIFSEEDKNSELSSIIPGLQRLGKQKDDEVKLEKEEEEEEEVKEKEEIEVSRPYLSEAWDVFEEPKKQYPLMNWRIPPLSSEIDMKDHLRCWAHTVASNVIR